MRLVVHIWRVLVGSVRYSIAERRLSVAIVVLVGLVLLAVALTTQTLAPLVIYPFA